jgi:hypothetical protein
MTDLFTLAIVLPSGFSGEQDATNDTAVTATKSVVVFLNNII